MANAQFVLDEVSVANTSTEKLELLPGEGETVPQVDTEFIVLDIDQHVPANLDLVRISSSAGRIYTIACDFTTYDVYVSNPNRVPVSIVL